MPRITKKAMLAADEEVAEQLKLLEADRQTTLEAPLPLACHIAPETPEISPFLPQEVAELEKDLEKDLGMVEVDGKKMKRLNYTKEALADLILTNPQLTQKEIALVMGRTPAWVGYVIRSDQFQSFLAERKDKVLDPVLAMSIKEKIEGLASLSLDVLMAKLSKDDKEVPASLALEALEIATKANGYGARSVPGVGSGIVNNFVVALPSKVESPEAWAEKYQGGNLEAGKQTITISSPPAP